MRFGKHAPKHDYRTFRFPSYAANLPEPPAEVNNIRRVADALPPSTDLAKLFPMDGNDRYGDCTIAAIAHAVTFFKGLLGIRKVMAESSVLKLYRHLTGGEDTGLNMLDVLNYWRKHTIETDKILAFAKIDPRNHKHVKQAIQVFGGVYTGFQCQQNVLTDFDAHRPWTPGKLTQDGHAIYTVNYDADTVTVFTWGSTQKGTWAWWDECVDEAYVVLPPEAKKQGFAPGFDFAALEADLATVTVQ